MKTEWKQARVGDILKIRNGYAVKSSDYSREGIPLIRQSDIDGDMIDISTAKRVPKRVMEECGQYLVRKGDLLIGMSGSLGKIGRYVDEEVAVQNQRTGLLQLKPGFSPGFARLVLKFVEPQIIAEGKGVAVQNVSAKEIEACTFPLPPEEEREEIVAEIEKQFTRLDAGVASLKRVQTALKRYRASVLKAACEGRLVPTETELARKENRSYETGEQLLQRILKERRAKWSGKGKYKEPATPTIVDPPSLPEGWTWASLDQLMLNITDGDHQPPPQTDSGVPFLVIRDVRSRKLDFDDTRFVSREYANQVDPFRKPAKGDILYTLVGSYGIALRVTTDQEFCIQRHIGVLRPHELSPVVYLAHILNSSFIFGQATKVATGTAQMTVPLAGLRRVAIPLPPVAEHSRIVAEVDRRLSVLEELEAARSTELQRAARLRQSILHLFLT